MALTITLKARGKRRIIESPPSDTPPFVPSASEPPHPTKRVRRAETRKCPVCDEDIPLRLLPMHALLEADRVEEIVKAVGSSDVLFEDFADEPGPSSRIRRSAIKARKNITSTRNTQDSLEQSNKTIQAVKRRRKQRSTKLKEMLKEDEERENSKDSWMRRFTGEEITCPVCLAVVRGDQDVLDAHVDSCLAHENRLLEEARQREAMHQYATEEDTWEVHDDRGGYVGDVRGAGFYRRDNDECVDEEIDIDGDDEAVFGEAQFTEGDVVPINPNVEIDEDIEVEIEDDDSPRREGSTLGNLVPVGNPGAGRVHGQKDDSGDTHIDITGMSETDKSELNILIARQQGDKAALVTALESKIKLLESNAASASSSVLCRICIDPYKEPTISTGCWHTCCKECWLRCLGSTKLCPICKRITGATDLRRIYL